MEYARVYKLQSTNGLVYYGSTTQKVMTKRLSTHKGKAKTGESSRSRLLFTDGATVTITLVENVENCKDKYELQARERWYIENNECVNKNIPNRTEEEIRVYHKEYRETHREKSKEKAKEWYQANKEKLKQKYQAHKIKILPLQM